MSLAEGQSTREDIHRNLEGERKREGSPSPLRSPVAIQKPTGLLKLLFRLPVYLYRLGLGGLLGRRLLLLTHKGRSSGRRHQTVLEVMRFDPGTGEHLVISAFGKGADWYLNLRASPTAEVHVGSGRFIPVLRFLTPEEGCREIEDYERRHPRAARFLLGLMGIRYDGSEEQRKGLAALMPVLSFRPED